MSRLVFLKKNKSYISVLLILFLLLNTACANVSNKQDNENSENSQNVSDISEWSGTGKCYKKVPYEYQNTIYGIWGRDGDEYVIASYYDDEGNAICEIIQNMNKIIYSTTSGIIHSITGGDGFIWVEESETDSYYNQTILLKKLASDGSELLSFRLDSLITVTGIIESMQTDINGNVFILLDGNITVIDSNGVVLSEIAFNNGYPIALVADGEGGIYARVRSTTNSGLFSLDAKTGKADKLLDIGERASYNGDESYFIYLTDMEGLWGITAPDSEAYEPIVIWSECNIDFIGLINVFPLNNDIFLCLDYQGAYLLVPASPDEVVPKTTVTLSCVSPILADAVSLFNLESANYRVSINDYSQGGVLSLSEAIMKLNIDLISGNTPDLILFCDMPIFPYIEKGLMTDLYQFLDADPEIGRDDFILLDKFETAGELFFISHSFEIELVFGLYSSFGDRYGWTLGEFIEKQSSLKDGHEVFPGVSRDYFLECVMRGYLQKAVDWESGLCDFDNEDFIAILNAAASIDPGVSTDFPFALYFQQTAGDLAHGERITSLAKIFNVFGIAEQERMAGEKLSVIGWPSVDGKCGTLLDSQYPIGICEKGKNKDGAWEFIKFLLCKKSPGMLINKALLDEEIDAAVNRIAFTPDDPLITTGNSAPLMSRDDADRLFALLNAIELVNEKNDDIMEIILEEAGAFFAGIRSIQDTVRIVQSRVGILISERS